MFYIVIRLTAKLILKLFFLLNIKGWENLPEEGGYIAAGNHVSFLDPVVAGASLPPRSCFMARSDLFALNKYFGLVLSALNALPLRREGADLKGIRIAIEALRKGRILIMFPEGTRSPDGSLKKGHAGIGMLALKTNVPIVPVLIVGTDRVLPRDKKFPRPGRIFVRFGGKIEPRKLKLSGKHKRDYQIIVDEVMKRIAGLRETQLKQRP